MQRILDPPLHKDTTSSWAMLSRRSFFCFRRGCAALCITIGFPSWMLCIKSRFCTDTHGVESAEVLHFSRQNSLRAESFFIFGEPMGVYHYGENNV